MLNYYYNTEKRILNYDHNAHLKINLAIFTITAATPHIISHVNKK